jgi:hypothetical protein
MLHRRSGRFDLGAIVFGCILLFVGGYYVLRNTLGFNLAELEWESLWPILVVLLGVSVLVGAMTRRQGGEPPGGSSATRHADANRHHAGLPLGTSGRLTKPSETPTLFPKSFGAEPPPDQQPRGIFMTRTTRRLGRLFGLLAAASIVVAACGGSAAPALTDPKEIVTTAMRTAQAAKSVHVDATIDGSISADLSGNGASGAAIPLTGTTAAADVDLAAGNAHATFSVPALLNLSGELIQIGGTSYVKTSLTGDKYQIQKAADSLPVNPTDSKSLVDTVNEAMAKPGVDPVKGDDVACGGTQCYTVKMELTAAELSALDSSAPIPSGLPVDLSGASLNLTIRVEKDTTRLAGLAATVTMGEQGSLTIDLTFSKWDGAVSISAPPPDQIQAAS